MPGWPGTLTGRRAFAVGGILTLLWSGRLRPRRRTVAGRLCAQRTAGSSTRACAAGANVGVEVVAGVQDAAAVAVSREVTEHRELAHAAERAANVVGSSLRAHPWGGGGGARRRKAGGELVGEVVGERV